MAVFVYKGVVVATGKATSGVRDADNPKALRSALKREGIMLSSASEDARGGAKSKSGKFWLFQLFAGRVSVDDIAMMTRQLSTLIMAQIPLVEAVAALTEQVENLELKRVLTQVRDRLNEGKSFAKAIEEHPKVFSPLYVNMVLAGESSGTLDIVLERLADFIENQARLRGKVFAALMYPTLMVGIGFLVLGILMTQVVPNLVQSFATAGQELPWNTQLLILVSNVLSSTEMVGAIVGFIIFVLGSRGLKDEKAESQKVVDQQREKVAKEKREARGERETKTVAPPKKGEINGMLAGAICVLFIGVILMFVVKSIPAYFTGMGIGVVFGLIVGRFFRFLGTDAGRLWRDTMSLRLPILGPLLKMLSVARFARTLATLLKSGVPLLKAMDIVKNVLENARLSQIVEEASVAIREGSGIAQTFKRNREFPPIVVHMIAVGEKSGQLENMLENVAKAYDTQVETKVQGLTSLLEPLIIVFMGGAVGFVAFSILMPLMQSNDFVQ